MSKKFILFLLLFNLIALPLIYVLRHPNFLYKIEKPIAQSDDLPFYGQMPDFQLTDSDNKPFDLKKMEGSVWVLNFIFTRCPNQCPFMSLKFAGLQSTLPSTVRLGSFSVDPEHDTPEVLAKYSLSYSPQKDRWFFVTGALATIRHIMSELHLGNSEDPGMHSLRFVLLDQDLKIRGYYNFEDHSALEQLKRDIMTLLKDKS